MIIALMLVALIVGVLIGAIGIGGILLIPAINQLTDLTIHASMATALFTFIFTGILGTFLFNRRGSIDWSITIPLCVGAAVFGFFGALVNSKMDGRALTIVLSILIIVAGINTVFKRSSERVSVFRRSPQTQQILLFIIGGVAGFGSGLTGVGGPALSVPIMLLFGFNPLTAIAASQVIQILAAVSGTIGNLEYGSIDFQLAAALTAFEIVGVQLGVVVVHAVNASSLRGIVGVFCMVVGAGLMLRVLEIL
jgi:uncharacterized membrane protein YfcA